jgi:hypothetical protein
VQYQVVDECDLESFRSFLEELVVEALDVEEDGVAVVLPRLRTLSKENPFKAKLLFFLFNILEVVHK